MYRIQPSLKLKLLLVLLAALTSFSLVSAQEDMAEAHRVVVDRVAEEGLVQGDDAVLEEFIADDYVVHTPFGDLNRDAVRDFFAAMRAAMTGFSFTREIMVAEGDLVATRSIASGTFESELNSPFGLFQPTGQPFSWEIINIFHFNEAGQIQEEWAQYDTAAFFAQLAPAPAASAGVLSEEAAQAFADRFDTIFDGANVGVANEIFSPEFVGHLPLAPVLDLEGWKAYVASFYDAFPDLTQEVNQVIVAPDRVILHVTYTGTHEGALFGIPATGNSVSMDGIGIFSFDENGLATENWAVIDVVGVLAQIGAFPPAPAE